MNKNQTRIKTLYDIFVDNKPYGEGIYREYLLNIMRSHRSYIEKFTDKKVEIKPIKKFIEDIKTCTVIKVIE